MFEEDVRSEQFESNTFKPRYPVFLNDPNLSTNGTAAPSGPPPQSSNNLYPSANISAVTPTPPRAAITPSAPPPSAPEMQPLNPPQPVMPQPSQSINQHNTSKSGPGNQAPLEVLGFSLPPDYEPTPSDGTSTNIGWK